MDLLVLGGTLFLGRHVVEAALARGHRVTLFHRGTTNRGLFPAAEAVYGDRAHDLGVLAGRRWDAVIDTSAYVPRVAAASALALGEAVRTYIFVSTISVYRSPLSPGADETAPLEELPDAASEDVQAHYGALKAACERVIVERFGERACLVRPGLIVGPHDPTDRFTSWVARAAEGGEMLAPGDGSQPVQVIDVRDLAAWLVDLAQAGAHGTYNTTGPRAPLTMRGLLELCAAETGAGARLTWADERFLLEAGVQPWSELPLWLPGEAGLLSVDIAAALEAGLRFRPLAETVRDTLAWHRRRPAAPLRAGLSREREADLLARWHERHG